PRADHDDRDQRDEGEHDEHHPGLEAPVPPLLVARRGPPRPLVGDEARVELVDVQLAVEAEVVRVRAHQALDVRLRPAAPQPPRPGAPAAPGDGLPPLAPPGRTRPGGGPAPRGCFCRPQKGGGSVTPRAEAPYDGPLSTP